VNPVRSLLAIIGGIALISLVVEPLEFTLVNAVAGQPIPDLAGYFEVRNRGGILAAKLVYNTLAAVLGGYMTAKIAGERELAHAGLAAAVETAMLVWTALAGEYAHFTPGWMWGALIVLTGPAMMAGASVRARAARVETRSTEVQS